MADPYTVWLKVVVNREKVLHRKTLKNIHTPNLAPSDFNLFPSLKAFRGKGDLQMTWP